MSERHRDRRDVAIVIGCGDIGSAIASVLHGAGYAVVLSDHVDPPWSRRGMAFTNAWYIGNAELEGEAACFCASVRTISTLLAQRLIAATTWSWAGIAEALAPSLIVDARMQADRSQTVLLGSSSVTVGVGAGFLPGVQVDLVVDADDDERPEVEERLIVRADRPGRFMTSHRIGAPVRAGEVIGHLGAQPLFAPADGVLRGLSARGARIHAGAQVIEVDPRGDPVSCFGLGQQQRRVATNVVDALVRPATRRSGLVTSASPEVNEPPLTFTAGSD
jgi:xanthine dehydrogenase accessory factor